MERSLQVKNYTFHYWAAGDASNPPMLWLHGFMGDRYEFQAAIAVLSQKFYCLAIDLPGHGETSVAHEVRKDDLNYEMQPIANGIAQFLEALKIEPCILIGYSMGGRLGLYLVLNFPEYFQKAVLESASPGLKTETERKQRSLSDRKLARELERGDLDSFLAKWYDRPLFASTKAHPNFEKMLARRVKHDPRHLAKSLSGMSTGRQPSLWEALRNVRVPLLLMAGELDRKFVTVNTEMTDLCNGYGRTHSAGDSFQDASCRVGAIAKLEVIPNCGHNIHFENTNEFIRILNEFLQ